MARLKLSRSQKLLLAWSACFLMAAELVKHLSIQGRLVTAAGLVEVALAMLTGIAFGITATGKEN